MNLIRIFEWSHGWGNSEQARAIAAAGFLARLKAEEIERALSSDGLRAVLKRPAELEDGRFFWGTSREDGWNLALELVTPEAATELWDGFVQEFPHTRADNPTRPRLSLCLISQYLNTRTAAATYAPISEALLHEETRIASLFLEWWDVRRTVRPRRAWRWPLRVGFAPEYDALAREVGARWRSRHGETIDFFPVGKAGEACDLFISDVPSYDTREAIKKHRARASVIVFPASGPLDSPELFGELVDLRESARASAVIVLEAPSADAFMWALEELSHDEPVDTAFHRAFGSLRGGGVSCMIIGDRQLVAAARLTRSAGRLARNFAQAGLRGAARGYRDRIPKLDYAHESAGATELAEQAMAIDAERKPREPRYLQADTWRLSQEKGPGSAWYGDAVRTDHFAAGHVHLVDIYVGPLEVDAVTELPAFPEDKIEWRGDREELKVAIVSPEAEIWVLGLDRPDAFEELARPWPSEAPPEKGPPSAIGAITIQEVGSSTHVYFGLRPAEGMKNVEARVLLIHANRVLQTALLSAEVSSDVEAGEAERSVPLRREGVAHASLEDLDERQTFDAAFVANRNADGAPRVTVIRNQRIDITEFTEGKQAASRLRESLETLTLKSDLFVCADSDAMRDLLVELAREGVRLHRALVRDSGLTEELSGEGLRVQLIMTKPECFVPLEFVYDEPAPRLEEAEICPNRAKALDEGSCGRCPHRASSDYVCPMRFWGLNKVVERHLFRPARDRGSGDKSADEPRTTSSIVERPRLRPPTSAVFARSDKAEDFEGGPQAIDHVWKSLLAMVRGAKRASTWSKWRDHVGAVAPTLLVLLPHTELRGNEALLGIGNADFVGDVDIDESIVGDRNLNILVLLLGCDTADPQLAYASFTTHFRHAGADVIVGTLSSVLGRHVAPVTKALIERLHETWSDDLPETFGQVLTLTRRQFMSRGLPIGLSIVGYGDADWVLG